MKLLYKKTFILFTAVCLIWGCAKSSEKSKSDVSEIREIHILDFEREFNKINNSIDTITINSLAGNIEIICLETTEKSLLSNTRFMLAELDGDYYVSSGMFHSSSGVIRFDAQGKFKGLLVEKGQGPLELPYLTSWSANDSLHLISMFGAEIKLITYNTISQEKHSTLFSQYGFSPYLLNDSHYVAYVGSVPNIDKSIPYLIFFDTEGKIIRSLYYSENRNVGYEIKEDHPQGIIYEGYGVFKSNDGNVLLKDAFNDTIYKAMSVSEIHPYICIYRGKMTPKYEYATDIKRQSSAIYIRRVSETEDYFFTTYLHEKTLQTAIWSKKERKIILRNVVRDQRGREFNYDYPLKYRTPKGDIIFLNMVYTKANTIYCLLRVEDAIDFVEGVTSDSNPLIVKISL